jgi:NAD+ kinase
MAATVSHLRPRRVAVVVHPRRDSARLVGCISRWAGEERIELSGLAAEDMMLPDGFERLPADELGRSAQLVVAIGGDGTILRALRLAAPHRVPVLGVNLGRLGFLAEVDRDDFADALEAVGRGEHAVERHVAIAAEPLGGAALPALATAYNDVVLARIPGAGQARLEVEVDSGLYARFSADAVIVATPTGSTAYNFSAGGPIVSPRVEAILVTPVAPHSAFNRSLLVHPEEHVTVTVRQDSAPVLVEIDGREAARLDRGQGVALHVSPRPGLVVRLGAMSFYDRARTKLRLSESIELTD